MIGIEPRCKAQGYGTFYRGEVVHEAGGEQPLRRVSGLQREYGGAGGAEARGRSVLAAPVPQPLAALAPPGGAAAAYLSAARYVTGSRIDTSLFRPLPLRAHRGIQLLALE